MGEKYVLGAGFYARPGHEYKQFMHKHWVDNTLKYTDPKAAYVIVQDSEIKYPCTDPRFQYIHVPCNIGHVSNMLPFQLCGWTVAFITGAMLAYSSGKDYIFKEQDCLAFGPWVETIYTHAQKEGKEFLFGNSREYIIEQSLVWIKHSMIPRAIELYLSIPEPDSRSCYLPEDKFVMIEQKMGSKAGRLPFEFGRNRPWIYQDVFYIQQVMLHDLDRLEEIGVVNAHSRNEL
jgi:hypothetical protein